MLLNKETKIKTNSDVAHQEYELSIKPFSALQKKHTRVSSEVEFCVHNIQVESSEED